MAKIKIKDETRNIDKCECVYCGHKFDGQSACNSDMDKTTVVCPKCGKEMFVDLFIEYICHPTEDEE